MGAFKTFLEWLGNFDEEVYPIEIFKKEYLEEIHIDKLISNTDKGRLERAEKFVRTQPPRITKDFPKGYKLIEYSFKSFPSTTGQRARGFMVANDSGDVKECFCNCPDFKYSLHFLFVKNKLSRWNIPSRFKSKIEAPTLRRPPLEKNPEGRLFVCKHLAALRNYLITDK